MSSEDKPSKIWLSLNEAAKQLGVHPVTLRRWADDGEVAIMVTPGGHRRFAVTEINRLAEQRQRQRIVSGIEQRWADLVLNEARRQISTRPEAAWLSIFTEQQREHKRVMGRQLLDLMLKYISLKDGGEELLEGARAIGREHALDGLQRGLPLVEALRIILFFRDTMFNVALQLPEVAHVKAEVNAQLLRRIGALLATVELAVAETYDCEQHRPATDQPTSARSPYSGRN